MTVKELKAFRAKLIKARDYEANHLAFKKDSAVTIALDKVGIEISDDVVLFLVGLQPFHRRRYIAALFANSIAAIDAQIVAGV